MSAGRGGGRLSREIARLLALLADDRAQLRPLGEGDGAPGGERAGVFLAPGSGGRPVRTLPLALLSRLVSAGWVDRQGEGYRLNEAGRAWLRRRSGGAEPFRAQHQRRESRIMEVGGALRPVVVNAAESPLGWLRRRKGRDGVPLISDAQFQAGERLRQEFTFGQMTPSLTSRLDAVASSRRGRRGAPDGPAGLTEDALAARQRVERALASVGPELSGILLQVCCHLQGLEEAEKAHGWPRRSGKVILQIALTRLARHYGLLPAERGALQRASSIRHWGAQDYRPDLKRWL